MSAPTIAAMSAAMRVFIAQLAAVKKTARTMAEGVESFSEAIALLDSVADTKPGARELADAFRGVVSAAWALDGALGAAIEAARTIGGK